MVEKIIKESVSPATHCMICLHGLGASGEDLASLIPYLQIDHIAMRFIFPTAPVMPVTINQGFASTAWFDLHGLSLNSPQDEAGIRASQEKIAALIAEQIEMGIPAENIFLLGFSQGGAIALQTGLHYPQRLGGIIALSTCLTLADKIRPTSTSSPSIFIAHGKQDDVLPFEWGQMASEHLKGLGYQVDWHMYDIGHEINQQVLMDLAQWLQSNVIADPI